MNVLHLSQYFFPEHSGSTTRLYNILSNSSNSMSILTSNKTMTGQRIEKVQETTKNISIQRINVTLDPVLERISPLHYAHSIWYQPKIIASFANEMKFDIIHAHDILSWGHAGRLIKEQTSKPFIIEIHSLSQEYANGLMKALKVEYLNQSEKRLLTSCDHIITLTNLLKEEISTAYKVIGDKITVVPNGVDVNQFTPCRRYEEEAGIIRQELQVQGKVIMYAGYLDKMNGIDDLIKIIPDFLHEKPDCCFIFIGHGPAESKLRRLSEHYPNNVKLLQTVQYIHMPIYYQMCDIFILPRPSNVSTETIVPLKLLEAMAMEKIVIGSDVGGISQVIHHGENGYLFKKNTVKGLAELLKDILYTDDKQIGKSARRKVVENYDWNKSAKILDNVYRNLLF